MKYYSVNSNTSTGPRGGCPIMITATCQGRMANLSTKKYTALHSTEMNSEGFRPKLENQNFKKWTPLRLCLSLSRHQGPS